MHLRSISPNASVSGAGRRAQAIRYALETRTAADDRIRGGDVFDAYERWDGSVSIVLADISSKGAAGFADAKILRDRFRHIAPDERSPSYILAALNTLQCEAAGARHSDTFAAVFVATVSRATRVLCYASAGHDTALVVRGRTHKHLGQTGPVIGVMRDATFADCFVAFDAGELLVIATDGFTECRKDTDRDRQFGTSGIVRALGADPHSHASAAAAVARCADVFTGCGYRDDATLVAIARA